MFFIRYPVPEIRDEVPENFSKPPNLLTADGSARIGRLSGGLKELLTFNKCERFPPVHNVSFEKPGRSRHVAWVNLVPQ
jgi:hypothetical protein